jgi:hypothetical protein
MPFQVVVVEDVNVAVTGVIHGGDAAWVDVLAIPVDPRIGDQYAIGVADAEHVSVEQKLRGEPHL